MNETLYLTRLETTRRERRSVYEMHRTLSTIYQGEPRLLWFDEGDGTVLVQTQSRITPQSVARTTVEAGSRFDFILRANAVRRRGKDRAGLDPARARESTTKITAPHELTDWLNEKAQSNGFTVLDALIPRNSVVAGKPSHAGHWISEVTFKGLLHVDDAGLFAAAMANGIGRSKAFGCGLLLLRTEEGIR